MPKPPTRTIAMRRVCRATVGALWSVPLRLLTIPAIALAMIGANGGALSSDDVWLWPVLLSGIGVSLLVSLADRLSVEFALFPALIKFFKAWKGVFND